MCLWCELLAGLLGLVAMGSCTRMRECWCVVMVAVLVLLAGQRVVAGSVDSWELVVANAGVSAMSATLMNSNRVVFYDRTDFGASNLTFPDGYCRDNPNDLRLKHDCTAHSAVLDLATNTVSALKIFSDAWCSSGAQKADGSFLSTGGWNDGSKVIRTLGPKPTDDWHEFNDTANALVSSRWYASNHILPDNRVIVVGGRRAFSYEFVPRAAKEGEYQFPFLKDTNTAGSEHNLYPFVFLNTDGNLFIFANQDSILFDYKRNTVVKKYPKIADGPRNYPASGSAVLLPLSAADGYKAAEVLVCGGCNVNAFQNAEKGIFDVALQSCGRMVITAAAAKWTMTTMPMPRVMGDMLLLAHGEVLIINGCGRGSAGWTDALDPVLTPVTYDPARNRFFTWRNSTIPRVYHSTALVLPDQKIFVAGSNTNSGYDFKMAPPVFPTELRIEKYSPFYLNKAYDIRRPKIVAAPAGVKYNQSFKVSFQVAQAPVTPSVRLYAPPFTTHTFSMNQRLLVLKVDTPVLVTNATAGSLLYSFNAIAPPSSVIAPAGYYLCSVVNAGTPGSAVWVKVAA